MYQLSRSAIHRHPDDASSPQELNLRTSMMWRGILLQVYLSSSNFSSSPKLLAEYHQHAQLAVSDPLYVQDLKLENPYEQFHLWATLPFAPILMNLDELDPEKEYTLRDVVACKKLKGTLKAKRNEETGEDEIVPELLPLDDERWNHDPLPGVVLQEAGGAPDDQFASALDLLEMLDMSDVHIRIAENDGELPTTPRKVYIFNDDENVAFFKRARPGEERHLRREIEIYAKIRRLRMQDKLPFDVRVPECLGVVTCMVAVGNEGDEEGGNVDEDENAMGKNGRAAKPSENQDESAEDHEMEDEPNDERGSEVRKEGTPSSPTPKPQTQTRILGLLLTHIPYTLGTLWHPFWISLPLSSRRTWKSQITYTLSHLHAHGISWGEVSPKNIIIDDDGDAWVVDFEGKRSEEGWVDEGVLGTVRGDRMGLERLEEYLEGPRERRE